MCVCVCVCACVCIVVTTSTSSDEDFQMNKKNICYNYFSRKKKMILIKYYMYCDKIFKSKLVNNKQAIKYTALFSF